MKKILLVMVFTLIAGGVFAHPPRNVDVMVEGKNIVVNISHPVGTNGKIHFVEKVDIYVNGKKKIKQTVVGQNADDIALVYTLPDLKPEDVIKVKASCNKYGNKSKKVKIEKVKVEEEKSKKKKK